MRHRGKWPRCQRENRNRRHPHQVGYLQKQRSVYVNINDLDFFNLVYRTTRFIESWELTYGPKLIRDARKLLSEQRAATQQ